MITHADLDVALTRARKFLAKSQQADGAFPGTMTLVDDHGAVVKCVPDHSVFLTMYLALAIADDPTPMVAAMVQRAEAFVTSESNGPGVWRYYRRSAQLHTLVVCDCDTTAGVLTLKRRLGRPIPNSRFVLSGNRGRKGTFYTWITVGNILSLDLRYWWFVLRDINFARAIMMWRRTSARRDDVDVVVNANVVGFLGCNRSTCRAILWVLQTVRLGEEKHRDRWYQNRVALYYAMGRAYSNGVQAFGSVGNLITKRLVEAAAANGEIDGNVLNTALSISALLYLKKSSEIVDHAVAHLLLLQDEEGAWPSQPFFFGGKAKRLSFESREITTAFAIEALNLYCHQRSELSACTGGNSDA